MFAAPPVIKTEVFAEFPADLLVKKRKSLLEGPSFDKAGDLYVVNVWHGQVLKISPAGVFSLVAQFDGEPSGLKIASDGTIFVTDHKQGLLTVDPKAGTIKVVTSRHNHEPFKGVGDLSFDSGGNLYFTDQGETGLHDPSGRLFRRGADGKLKLLLANIPSPNGLVPSKDERILLVAATRANAVWKIPIRHDDTLGRVANFIQLSGGIGPDGLAMDEAGNVAVAHAGMGSIWLFDEIGRPIAEVRSCRGKVTTNIAYGGSDRRTLYITEAETGSILVAQMDVPGRVMPSHMEAGS
jgi:gluconolactonase